MKAPMKIFKGPRVRGWLVLDWKHWALPLAVRVPVNKYAMFRIGPVVVTLDWSH